MYYPPADSPRVCSGKTTICDLEKRINQLILLPERGENSMLSQNKPEHLEALVEPIRLRITNMLASRELQPRDLAAVLSLHMSTVSRHLGRLKEAGLVISRRGPDGRSMFYRLTDHQLIVDITELLSRIATIPPYSTDLKKLEKLKRSAGRKKRSSSRPRPPKSS